jgi:5-methylthioadenosine/S-adenosylhomocysteine deaminase
MRTAALVDKLQAKDATALPGWQMLKLATINGAKVHNTHTRTHTHAHTHDFSRLTTHRAKALGLEHKIGSLEKGKEADVVAIKLRTEPVYNPITNLVYVGTNRYPYPCPISTINSTHWFVWAIVACVRAM